MARTATANAAPAAPVSRRPKDSPFLQQRLKAWQPILSPLWIVITFCLVAVVFVPIGFWLLTISNEVVELYAKYDGPGADPALAAGCTLANATPGATAGCTISLTAPKDMKGPVYVYYELSNFYQNHRRYVKSRSEAQITGSIFTNPNDKSLADCDPLRTRNGSILQPCGLVAQSYFNDTFTLSNASGLTMVETGIAWDADLKRFKGTPASVRAEPQYAGITWITDVYPNVPDITDEHFIVWMRTAALPTFRKLYGKFPGGVPANTTLTFAVSANFPVAGFDGSKALVVSTATVVGGKNTFLGLAYIVVGFACLGLAALFALRSYFGGRTLGDTAYLVWPTK